VSTFLSDQLRGFRKGGHLLEQKKIRRPQAPTPSPLGYPPPGGEVGSNQIGECEKGIPRSHPVNSADAEEGPPSGAKKETA